MKFIQLRIANYRKVSSREVDFGPTGMTVIQGRNGVGKTSLRESIGILFEYQDTSKHRAVTDIKPVHRDTGPEIELQARSGVYEFTYFKRFLKRPETRLTVTAPRPESLTGREAHERAEAILKETVDVNLWKALTILQGTAIGQPDMAHQTSLSAVLDKAAGGRTADVREDGLYGRVRSEYLLYWTPQGAELRHIVESRNARVRASEEVERIQRSLAELDQAIQRTAVLQRELTRLDRNEQEFVAKVALHSSEFDEIEKLESTLATARLKLDKAQALEEIAQQAFEERKKLVTAVAVAAEAYRNADESSQKLTAAFNRSEQELKRTQAALDNAQEGKKHADTLAALRRADHSYYSDMLHLRQFTDRKKRVDEARRKATDAEALLESNQVDEETLGAIDEANLEFVRAKAQLGMDAPGLRFCGLADCSFSLDGMQVSLRKGDVHKHTVADTAHVVLPGVLDMEIAPGTSLEGLQSKVEESRASLADACADAGVADAEEARRAFEKRRQASLDVEAKQRVEEADLQDLTYDELDGRLRILQKGTPQYLQQRVAEPVICPDQESAKTAQAQADSAQMAANEALDVARVAHDAARTLRETAHTRHREAGILSESAAASLHAAEDTLVIARERGKDSGLQSDLKTASDSVSSETVAVSSADSALQAGNPDVVRTLLETATGSLETARKSQKVTGEELVGIEALLRLQGEQGLQEELDMALVQLERSSYACQSMLARANAAKLLFDCMTDERDKARRSYVAPLKDRIEQLGGLVFDETIQVNISDELQIASLTRDGVTVPFDSLSGGEKEQLSLIHRLVCSMAVAEDGGAPFILDDALGYTDPERLPLVNAVLSKAAKDCQIIVLTCTPDRYSNLGQATVIPLA